VRRILAEPHEAARAVVEDLELAILARSRHPREFGRVK
jgi:hypothetical protein